MNGYHRGRDMSASTDDLARLELLASAIAGARLAVVPGSPGERSWTDGVSVFIDGELSARDRLAAVCVQASLLGAGSLGPEMLASLGRGRDTANRYLAIEGHRALLTHAKLLPSSVSPVIDLAEATRSVDAAMSLLLARGSEPIADPAAVLGVIRPRQVRAARVTGEADEAAPHVSRRNRQQTLRELDDGEDTARDGAFDLLNPVGGGGTVGRLLQKLLGNSRSKGKGTPGADAPTHYSKPRWSRRTRCGCVEQPCRVGRRT